MAEKYVRPPVRLLTGLSSVDSVNSVILGAVYLAGYYPHSKCVGQML